MAELLHAAVKRGIAPGYVRALLPRFGAAEQKSAIHGSIELEPLSERELDVLRLLASDLDGPDIARELTVSLSTMRTHTRSIFNKLGVSSRRAAVRRAEELRIITKSSHVMRLAHHIRFYLRSMPTDEGGSYEIRLKGRLDGRWAARFDGLSLTYESAGTTLIHGPVVDQAALHGLLTRVRDLGLPLISVTRVTNSRKEQEP